MDTITHIAIGACVGEVFLGKKLGKRVLLLGAIANSIPDIDFVASVWMSPANNLLAHRGFTHSFLFMMLVTPLLALFAERVHRPHNISLKKWIWFLEYKFLFIYLLTPLMLMALDGLSHSATTVFHLIPFLLLILFFLFGWELHLLHY